MTSTNPHESDEALAVARRAAAAMEYADEALRSAGVRLLDVSPGRSRTAMTVEKRHLNGHGLCHGGYPFMLADCALAFASNSYGPSAVASSADITFLRAGALGDELVADAQERGRTGRSGLYGITIRAADRVIVEFRGRTRVVPGLPPLPFVAEADAGVAKKR
jgi:acyl-CoA thioesterase